MRRMSWFLMGLGLSALALGQSAPRVEISPTVGYLFGGNLWDRTTEGPTLSVGDHLDYGLRAGWLASPRWAFEFDWTRVPTRLEFSPALSPISLDIDYLTPRVAYHFATGVFRPYVAGGLGAAIFATPESGSPAYFTTTLGVGLKVFPLPWLGARIEARGFASGVGDPPLGLPCNELVPGDDGLETVSCAHQWILTGDLTAGIVVAF
ncbi:MAG: hypothetical protein ABW056_02240 [Thermoanaerobaculia bacterium]